MLRRSWPWQWFSMLWLNLKFLSLEYRDWILQNKANSLIKSCELIYHFSVSYCVFSSFFFLLHVVCQQRRVTLISNQFSFANLPEKKSFSRKAAQVSSFLFYSNYESINWSWAKALKWKWWIEKTVIQKMLAEQRYETNLNWMLNFSFFFVPENLLA